MKISALAIVLSCIASLVACNSYEPPRHQTRSVYSAPRNAEHYGRVSDIQIITLDSKSSGGGAVLGAVIGGVLGHQVGGGRGRDVATGVGVIGGAVAGNKVEKRNAQGRDIYRITVQFENGSRQEFDYEEINDLRVGDRVRVERGQIERL